MIVQRFVCDRCSNDILTDNVFTISIEEKPKTQLDDIGEFEDSLEDAHFCQDCKKKILAYIRNEIEGKREIGRITEAWEPEELKLPYVPEVVQETSPSGRKKRLKGEELEQAKQRARELHDLGNGTADIAKELGLRYATVARWL